MSDDRPPDDPADRRRETGAERSGDEPRADAPGRDEATSTDSATDEPVGRDATEADAADAGPAETSSDGSHGDDPSHTDEERRDPDDGRSDRAVFWLSLLFGFALAVGAVALVSGRAPFFEQLFRVRPTVEGGGVGAGWLVGNTEPALEWLIVLVHFADVVMGIFILLMVFIHWAAFRRLAARMRPAAAATRDRETTAATDGGSRSEASGPDGGDSP